MRSPTYTYVEVYDDELAHLDLYRFLQDEGLDCQQLFYELVQRGLLELIEQMPYVAIEWPVCEQLLPQRKWLKVKIKKVDEEKRIVEVEEA